jgi:UDPglucose 6-dehydrogenase
MNELTGVIGEGWVGKSMIELFPEAIIYDEPALKERALNPDAAIRAGRAAIRACDVSFICVPTPNHDKGELDTSIVEEVVDWCDSDLIVIRSTVNPGTVDRLTAQTGKHIVMQPEYLGETPQHPMLDPNTRQFMVIGGEPKDRRKLIDLYTTVYSANIGIRQVSALEAEVIKLSENRAIAFKVAQAQELYDVCQAAGIDYYTIRDAVYGDDPRFNMWWTFIYPDKRGFNSKCIPKDVYAWAAWAESLGYDPELTNDLLRVNEKLIK